MRGNFRPEPVVIFTEIRTLANAPHEQIVLGENPPYVRIVYPVSAGLENPTNLPSGAVEVKVSLAPEFAYLAEFRVYTMVVGVVIVLAVSLVIALISHSITRPLRALYSGMGTVNEGRLDVHVPVVSGDEVGYLTSTFNGMIARLRGMIVTSQLFVPDQFLHALGKADFTDVRIGDATQRNMTVFFMDIRNFTDMSEQMSADDNLRLLNELLEYVVPAIEEHNGFIDKYMGDAVMALFPECPDDAVIAGLSLHEGVRVYNRERIALDKTTIAVGVGINSGDLILGTVGTGKRLDTTVIGITVNVASRLEKLTKEYDVPVIIPEHVYEQLQETTRRKLNVRKLGSVAIRGVEKEIPLVGVVGYVTEA